MSDGSTIEWLDWPGRKPATWNPIRGCTRVSDGCRNCYAETMAARFSLPGQWGHGVAEMRGGNPRWTGIVTHVESAMRLPLKWAKPRVVFVNSTSDLFHESVPEEVLDRIFGVMACCPQHRFIVLTKRADRMREYAADPDTPRRVFWGIETRDGGEMDVEWPLPNVVKGVSAEDQEHANRRIPDLAATPAACRMISYEPALGPLDLTRIDLGSGVFLNALTGAHSAEIPIRSWEDVPGALDMLPTLPAMTGSIDWVVAGGESGRNARPAPRPSFRQLRDQTVKSFFFKQHGEWISVEDLRRLPGGSGPGFGAYDHCRYDMETERVRVGKKAAGRLLDGREWNELPASMTS